MKRSNQRVVVDSNSLKKAIIAFLIGGAALGSVGTLTAEKINKKINDTATFRTELASYYGIVSDNTHRTTGRDGYYYDYAAIASAVGSDQIKLLSVYDNIGSAQTDKVVSKMSNRYPTLSDYLNSIGYDNIDEWREKLYNKILAQAKVREAKNAMATMLNSASSSLYNNNDNTTSYGGK